MFYSRFFFIEKPDKQYVYDMTFFSQNGFLCREFTKISLPKVSVKVGLITMDKRKRANMEKLN